MEFAETSWLTAALLQSGATVVAIAGGMMGTRFISTHAELTGARHDWRAENQQVLASEKRARDLEHSWTVETARQYTQGQTFLAYLVDPARRHLVDLKLQKLDQPLQEAARNQVRLLQAELDVATDRIGRRRDLARPGKTFLQLNPESERRATYTAIFLQAYLRAIEPYRGLSSAHEDAFQSLRSEIRRWHIEMHAKIEGRIASIRERQRETDEDLRAARRVRQEAGARVRTVQGSEGFSLGLGVLAAVAALTMLPPLALLIIGSKYYPLWVTIPVVVVFATGLCLLWLFLRRYSSYLRGSHEDSLPTDVWTLVAGHFRRRERLDGVSPATDRSTST